MIKFKKLKDKLFQEKQTYKTHIENFRKAIDTINIDELYHSYKDKFNDFLSKINTEKKGTKEAFGLLKQHVFNGTELSDKDKEKIGEQLKDTLKTAGLVSLVILPGGTVFIILVHFLKLTKYITPSAFLEKQDDCTDNSELSTDLSPAIN